MTTTLDAPALGTADRNVAGFDPVPTPAELLAEHPLGAGRAALVERSRSEIARILDGTDDRVLLVVGPETLVGAEASDLLALLKDRTKTIVLTASPSRLWEETWLRWMM